MSTPLTVALLSVLTTVGLVGAVVTDGAVSVAWAVGTVVVAGALALRLRSAPPGTSLIAAFVTGILIVSGGMPVAIVMTEDARSNGAGTSAAEEAIDPSNELRSVLAKAEEVQAGSTATIREVRISAYWSQIRYLDLARGEEVWFQFSRVGSSHDWSTPTRTPTTYRADSAFGASDLARLDLTAAARKVDDAARGLGIDLSKRSSSDGLVIARRSSDKRLVVSHALTSRTTFETDTAGNLPDNLALAKVDGLLPAADRLLRTHGIDPAAPVIAELAYRAFGDNASSIGSAHDPGSIRIRVSGSRSGNLAETVGRFPEVGLTPSTGSGSDGFALSAVSAAGIERARADVQQRFAVPPIDAHAIGLEYGRDTDSPGWMRGGLPPILQLGLGPVSSNRAAYHPDGTFARAR